MRERRGPFCAMAPPDHYLFRRAARSPGQSRCSASPRATTSSNFWKCSSASGRGLATISISGFGRFLGTGTSWMACWGFTLLQFKGRATAPELGAKASFRLPRPHTGPPGPRLSCAGPHRPRRGPHPSRCDPVLSRAGRQVSRRDPQRRAGPRPSRGGPRRSRADPFLSRRGPNLSRSRSPARPRRPRTPTLSPPAPLHAFEVLHRRSSPVALTDRPHGICFA